VKKKAKEPFVPPERTGTIRQDIISLLEENAALTAKDISAEVRIPEKEVYGHLEHVQKSLNKVGHHLHVKPAECLKCGFVFAKREKLKTPGRCPVCHEEHIQEAFFSITAVMPRQ
jgi:predicted Zn-ribbon and HTH transcriptional regulator